MLFRGQPYILFVSTLPAPAGPSPGQPTLVVEVEHRDTGSRWSGDFSARYVEDICAKTGSYKRFHTFVHMLTSAARGDSDSLSIDLLSYGDLEALKRMRESSSSGRADAAAAGGGSGPPSAHSSKRYLILTYTSEFDRVHYPVPLGDEAEPDVPSLQRTCMRLRDELRAMRALQGEADAAAAAAAAEKGGGSGGGRLHVRGYSEGREAELAGELRRLREENVTLRVQLKRLEQRDGPGRTGAENAQAQQLERAIRDGRVLDRELALANKDRESLRGRLDRALEELVRHHRFYRSFARSFALRSPSTSRPARGAHTDAPIQLKK